MRALAEHWDGNGGPDGLWSTQIPPSARIVAVADVLDLLLHGESGSSAIAPHVAADWLQQASGRQFDPAIIDVCLAFLAPPVETRPDLAAISP